MMINVPQMTRGSPLYSVVGCHRDNLRFHQWRQSLLPDNSERLIDWPGELHKFNSYLKWAKGQIFVAPFTNMD